MAITFERTSIKIFNAQQANPTPFPNCACQQQLIDKTAPVVEKILRHPKFISFIQEFKRQLGSSNSAADFHIRVDREYLSITPLNPAHASQTRRLKVEEQAEKTLFDLDKELIDKAKEVWQQHLAHQPAEAPRPPEAPGGSPAAAAAPGSSRRRRRAEARGDPVRGVGFRVDPRRGAAPSAPVFSVGARVGIVAERTKVLKNHLIWANTFETQNGRDLPRLIETFANQCSETDKHRIYHHVYWNTPPARLDGSPEYGQNSFLNNEGYRALSHADRARAMRNFVLEELALLTAEHGPTEEVAGCFNQLPQADKEGIATQLARLVGSRDEQALQSATHAQKAQALLNHLAEINRFIARDRDQAEALEREITLRQQRLAAAS